MLMATLALTVLGIGLGVLLGFAARFFAVEPENPLVKEIEAMMPGSQCGQCGFPGCSGAAHALVAGEAPITCCPPGGKALVEQLAEVLGVSAEGAELAVPMVASINEAECTGCTRCYRACPTDAVVGANGQIHIVMQSACTGCAKCAEACPEDCVSLNAESATLDTWRWNKPEAA